MRSATRSRQKPDPALRTRRWDDPCHACSPQFGDVHGAKGERAARLSHSSPTQRSSSRTRDAPPVMAVSHEPHPQPWSSWPARPLETSIDSLHSCYSPVEAHRPPATITGAVQIRHLASHPRDLLPCRLRNATPWSLAWNIKAPDALGVANVNASGVSPAYLQKTQCTTTVADFLERAWPSSRP